MTTKGKTVYVDVDGQKAIIKMFNGSYKGKKTNVVGDIINVDDNKDLVDEVLFLRNLVDKLQSEKSELHKIVDQQQQLTLQSNKQIDHLQQQLLLTTTDKEESKESKTEKKTPEEDTYLTDSENPNKLDVEENNDLKNKKWYQFWK